MSSPLPIRYFKRQCDDDDTFFHTVKFTEDFGCFKKDESITYMMIVYGIGTMYESDLDGNIIGRVQKFKCVPCDD